MDDESKSDAEDAITAGEDAQTRKIERLAFACPVDHVGTTVYVKGWRMRGGTQPPIVLIHDLGETIELYRDAAKAFSALGHSVYGYDLRGHGRSGRRLGHVTSFHSLVTDLLQVVAWVKHKESGRLPILVSQGIGALVAGQFQLEHAKRLASMIMIAPSFHLRRRISPPLRLLIRALAEVSPTMKIPQRLTPHFSDMLDLYRRGSESGVRSSLSGLTPKITTSFARELVSAIDHSDRIVRRILPKTLVVCPEADELCRYDRLSAALSESAHVQVSHLEEVGHHALAESVASLTKVMSVIKPWLGSPEEETNRSESSVTMSSSPSPSPSL